MNLFFNEKEFQLHSSNLPILIHGADKMGASFFTIKLTIDFFEQGYNLIFFSAFTKAREALLEKVDNSKTVIVDIQTNIEEISMKQLILPESGNQKALLYTLDSLRDVSKRIIIIKNVESIEGDLLERLIDLENIVFSGDFDKSSFTKELWEKKYKTKIFFSEPQTNSILKIPELLQYEGFMETGEEKGVIEIS